MCIYILANIGYIIYISPGVGNGNPLQCSCLENPMDIGAQRATIYRVAKSRTRLSDLTSYIYIHIAMCIYISLYLLCRYFLPFHRLPFPLCFLCCSKTLEFDIVSLVSLGFSCLCFWCCDQKIVTKANVKNFSPYIFGILTLTFKSLIHFSLFLCIVWGEVSISFFYIWTSSSPNTIFSHYVFLDLWLKSSWP